jgi:hypothetical protein
VGFLFQLTVKQCPRDQAAPRRDHRQVDPLTAASTAILQMPTKIVDRAKFIESLDGPSTCVGHCTAPSQLTRPSR